jgi:putative glutamine amidotransferase
MARRRYPIVGIPTHSRHMAMSGLPPAFTMGQHYTRALALAGAAAILLPLYEDPDLLRTLYDQTDGLFLAGGSDVNPGLYRAAPHPLLGELDEERDRVELQCIAWALADRRPILAICRGMQVLNVARGGSLHQDIATELPGALEHNFSLLQPRDYLAHPVDVLPGTRLASVLGTRHTLVNSLHHQAIRTLAPDLRPTAHAADGIIEALEGPDPEHFVLGVQWHPEALTDDPKMLRLFTSFVDATRAG